MQFIPLVLNHISDLLTLLNNTRKLTLYSEGTPTSFETDHGHTINHTEIMHGG